MQGPRPPHQHAQPRFFFFIIPWNLLGPRPCVEWRQRDGCIMQTDGGPMRAVGARERGGRLGRKVCGRWREGTRLPIIELLGD